MKKILLSFLSFMFVIMAVAQEKKYNIKSGMMNTITNVMGQRVESILYFDDYGNLECSLTKNSKGGTELFEVSTISKGGIMYIVNPLSKQIQEIPIPETINYLHLTPEIIKEYNIQELGSEKVLGKDCVKYSAETLQSGQKSSVIIWVWEGLPLKTITTSNGIEISVAVSELHINMPIDQNVFAVPEIL